MRIADFTEKNFTAFLIFGMCLFCHSSLLFSFYRGEIEKRFKQLRIKYHRYQEMAINILNVSNVFCGQWFNVLF